MTLQIQQLLPLLHLQSIAVVYLQCNALLAYQKLDISCFVFQEDAHAPVWVATKAEWDVGVRVTPDDASLIGK